MHNSLNLQSRSYSGKGKLHICSVDVMDSYACVYFRNGGKHTITCWFYLTNEYARVLSDILERQMSTVVYATFNGENTEGVNISIEKMALNETNFSANSTTTDPKYVIRHDLLLDILSKTGKTLYASAISSQNFLNVVRLEFIIHSDIRVRYREIQDDELVTSHWGLTNFYLGSESVGDCVLTPNNEILFLNVSGSLIEIKRVPSYSNILSQLKSLSSFFLNDKCAWVILRSIAILLKNHVRMFAF